MEVTVSYSIDSRRFNDFMRECGGHSRMPMGVVPSAVALAFTVLDERGQIDHDVRGYSDAAGFAEHVSLINNGFDWFNADDYSDDELRAIVLHPFDDLGHRGSEFSTSTAISDLALGILDVKEGESLADLGAGIGSFMLEAYEQTKLGSFYGVEEVYDAAKVASIRAIVLGVDADIDVGDMFRREGKYDKVMSNFPLNLAPIGRAVRRGESPMNDVIPEGVKVHSSDWAFNLKVAQSIAEGGTGIGVMALGALSNTMDEQVRAHLVRSGMIEAVVTMPNGLMSGTSIPCAFVVMSHGNKTVRLVDASDIGKDSRLGRRIEKSDVDEVVSRIHGDSEHACDVGIAELSETRWNLLPTRHLNVVTVKGGVPLSSLMSNITRGLGGNMQGRICEEVTPFRYLMMKNVSNGEIDDDLPYIDEVGDRERRYLVQDDDVILGKMRPFKAAVAHVAKDEGILAGGNLYILRPDTSKILPLYLRLFLESDLGAAQLEAHTTGTTIPSVPVPAFDEILVPLPSLEEQQLIVDRCEDLTKRAQMYERKAREVRDQIASLLDSEGGER